MSLINLIVLGCISLELFNVTTLFRIAPLLMMSLLLPALLCCMLVTQTCAQPPRSAPHRAAPCCGDGLSVQVSPAPPDSVCSCTAVPGRDEGRKQGMMLLLEILWTKPDNQPSEEFLFPQLDQQCPANIWFLKRFGLLQIINDENTIFLESFLGKLFVINQIFLIWLMHLSIAVPHSLSHC